MYFAERNTPKPNFCLQTGTPGPVLLGASDASRPEVETFIARTYSRHFGATLRSFLPNLLCLRDADRRVCAALGFRGALGVPLFLEHYLDTTVDCVLAGQLNRPCDRRGIVEVGNLAAAGAGGTRALITALTGYLKGAGHDWAVFTAVASLRNSFRRLGIELLTLGRASIDRLPAEEQVTWGSYYDTDPLVVAANVHQSYAALTAQGHSTGPHGGLLSQSCTAGWDAFWAQVA